MRTWKIALIGAVLAAAVIVTRGYYGHSVSTGDALAQSLRPVSAKTETAAPPIRGAIDVKEAGFGWGPVRTTDW